MKADFNGKTPHCTESACAYQWEEDSAMAHNSKHIYAHRHRLTCHIATLLAPKLFAQFGHGGQSESWVIEALIMHACMVFTRGKFLHTVVR